MTKKKRSERSGGVYVSVMGKRDDKPYTIGVSTQGTPESIEKGQAIAAYLWGLLHGFTEETRTDKYLIFTLGEGEKQEKQRGIFCFSCKKASYNANDIENRYCGFCHKFHEEQA